MKKIINLIPPKVRAYYLLWSLLNFILLILGWTKRNKFFDDDFFPFNGFKLDNYDLSEFFIYVITPIILFYIYIIYTGQQAIDGRQIIPKRENYSNGKTEVIKTYEESLNIQIKKFWLKYRYKPGFIGISLFLLGTLGYLIGFEWAIVLWPISAPFMMYALSKW